MDNVFIASLLVELMKEHNRVSLPCLGSFIGHNQSTYRMNKIFYPPYKRIDFYQNEIWNDEKLEKLIARRKRLSLGKAKEQLAFWIDDICLGLSSGKEVMLPGIGKLYVNRENRLIFEQNLIENFLLDSYGLEPVNLTPIEGRYNPIPNPEFIQELQNKKRKHIQRVINILLITLLICVGATILFLSYYKRDSECKDSFNENVSVNKAEHYIYRIQTGTHKKYNQARAEVRLLEEAGYSPGIYSVDSIYSVCIGIYYSVEDADNMLKFIQTNDSLLYFSKASIREGTIEEESL